jgi:hypothetical protein
MFLELPAIVIDEETDQIREFTVDINPFHVISIESLSKQRCLVLLPGELYYEITMSRTKLRKLIAEYVKENVLSKIYKELKDDRSN